MTTLALTPAPLRRLFDRIDEAAPEDHDLAAALDHWRRKRAGRVLPTQSDLDLSHLGTLGEQLFVFGRTIDRDDWYLLIAGRHVEEALRPNPEDGSLSLSRVPRLAARLRRVFALAAEKEEPVAAAFQMKTENGQIRDVELFAAPLGHDHLHIDGMCGGLGFSWVPIQLNKVSVASPQRNCL